MKPTLSFVLLGWLLLRVTLTFGAEAAKPAKPSEASFEALIAQAGRLAEGDSSAEIRQLASQLELLKTQRRALEQRLQATEAQLARAGGVGEENERLRSEIETLRLAISVIEEQILLLIERIQALRAPAETAPGKALRPDKVASVPPAQVNAAASQLAKNSQITKPAATSAAEKLLRTNNPSVTNVDIEALAQIILMQAQKEADADLKAQLEAAKKTNAEKKAMREAVQKLKSAEPSKP